MVAGLLLHTVSDTLCDRTWWLCAGHRRQSSGTNGLLVIWCNHTSSRSSPGSASETKKGLQPFPVAADLQKSSVCNGSCWGSSAFPVPLPEAGAVVPHAGVEAVEQATERPSNHLKNFLHRAEAAATAFAEPSFPQNKQRETTLAVPCVPRGNDVHRGH